MIKILIVDDSALVRQVLKKRLEEIDDFQVVGTAADPYIARELVVSLKPDVLTLDIEMPRMDGLSFLKKLMDYHPLPVIIVSSVTTNDDQAAFKALDLGAFDVVNKPGGSISIDEVSDDIARKIRQAYQVRHTFLGRRNLVNIAMANRKGVKETEALSRIKTTGVYIAIGSSTGGTIALEYLLSRLPTNLPPILIVQHMPENYTLPFAKRLNSLSGLTVKESEPNEIIQSGHVYIARGGVHLVTERKGTVVRLLHEEGKKVSYQRPSVDVMFASMARMAGGNTMAIMLTGMGSDGTVGMGKLKKKGALTIAQDEKSSIVWGMPKAAIEAGVVDKVLPLSEIPQEIINFSLQHNRI
ncbi:MAG: chemotaxis response regulator protein-glutamate methylesterase [Spirochaetales bacterium]|nr:chemotaxis response regulator protein-glutamate methylesterase [Spirochaetales bacterium]